jgi:hypothetical protein
LHSTNDIKGDNPIVLIDDGTITSVHWMDKTNEITRKPT